LQGTCPHLHAPGVCSLLLIAQQSDRVRKLQVVETHQQLLPASPLPCICTCSVESASNKAGGEVDNAASTGALSTALWRSKDATSLSCLCAMAAAMSSSAHFGQSRKERERVVDIDADPNQVWLGLV
jgi:hypothetical protein